MFDDTRCMWSGKREVERLNYEHSASLLDFDCVFQTITPEKCILIIVHWLKKKYAIHNLESNGIETYRLKKNPNMIILEFIEQ